MVEESCLEFDPGEGSAKPVYIPVTWAAGVHSSFALCLLAVSHFGAAVQGGEGGQFFPMAEEHRSPHCRDGFMHRGCAALSLSAKALQRVAWRRNVGLCLVGMPSSLPGLPRDSQRGVPECRGAPGALWEAAVTPHNLICVTGREGEDPSSRPSGMWVHTQHELWPRRMRSSFLLTLLSVSAPFIYLHISSCLLVLQPQP